MKWVAGLLCAFVLIVWAIWIGQYFVFTWLDIQWDSSKLGQWGDTFGALNALFAAFAFIGVAITLYLQSREIHRQQEQIDRSRIEADRQRFDSTFFLLLDLIRESRDTTRFRNSPTFSLIIGENPKDLDQSLGAAAFQSAANEASYWANSLSSTDKEESLKEFIMNYNQNIHRRSEDDFGPYYRLIYSLLKRIKTATCLNEAEKFSYGNLLRSQMSASQAILLGCNGLTPQSADMKSLIEYFRMLKYTPKNDGAIVFLRDYYKSTTFEARD